MIDHRTYIIDRGVRYSSSHLGCHTPETLKIFSNVISRPILSSDLSAFGLSAQCSCSILTVCVESLFPWEDLVSETSTKLNSTKTSESWEWPAWLPGTEAQPMRCGNVQDLQLTNSIGTLFSKIVTGSTRVLRFPGSATIFILKAF